MINYFDNRLLKNKIKTIHLLKYGFLVSLIIMNLSCKSALMKSSEKISLADESADYSAKYLMSKINEVKKQGYAFGHQDATAYGLDWQNDGNIYKSDVNDVSGDFPAVYGFELGHIELGHDQNLDSVNFGLMTELIQKAHKDGGIISISWHPDNPVTKKTAWDPSPAVSQILVGGALHPKYRAWLLKVAEFLKGLKTKTGASIPVVFRPYHEMNGSWFWWGQGSCTPKEFKLLWRETFELFTTKYNVHNLLYCYSTDAVQSEEEYLRFYPGNEYVDILGMDLYQHGTTDEYISILNRNLSLLANIAKQKNMPHALTEGGLNMVSVEDWWTQVLDKNISDKGLSWALFWRNARRDHYYVPFIGQKSSIDFKKFKELPHVLFLKEIKKIR